MTDGRTWGIVLLHMHVGIFLEEARPGSTPAQAFEDKFDMVDAAEAWGLDGVWLGEIHFNVARSVLSSPLVLAGAIAGRTRRLRIGTAVHLLPLNHPLRIAEDIATVDHISGGRFDFGVGRSGSPRAYDVLGVPYGESQTRFAEALDVIRQAWKG
ncbi:MAG TPA: LLM class flavin-dependent oxidoreductase, partial [Methylomirabilota bacterium]|nr:LLM class flavin-dependent oxidoreductase [Methylomirabilota bacterium]